MASRRLAPVVSMLAITVTTLAGCSGSPPRPEPPPATVVFYADGHTVLPDGMARNRVIAELATVRHELPAAVAAGYQVTSTIEQPLQQRLQAAAALPGQPAKLQAAAVVVQPGTGRVLAYYGGGADAQVDYAGMSHPPGQSFAVYDIAEALRQGVSAQSRWKAPARMRFRTDGRFLPIADSRRCPNNARVCTLADAVTGGLRVPLYALTERLGSSKVVEMAHAAGIDTIEAIAGGRSVPVDLRQMASDPSVATKYFGPEVGLGQHAIPVLDHANGMATFAAHGRRATVHFIRSVTAGGTVVFQESVRTTSLGLSAVQLDTIGWTLAQQPAGRLGDGRRTAAVTGTWQVGPVPGRYAHAWLAGYTPRYAMAVWIGNKTNEEPLRDRTGQPVTGATLPASVYRAVLEPALAGTPVVEPAQPPPFGDVTAGNA